MVHFLAGLRRDTPCNMQRSCNSLWRSWYSFGPVTGELYCGTVPATLAEGPGRVLRLSRVLARCLPQGIPQGYFCRSSFWNLIAESLRLLQRTSLCKPELSLLKDSSKIEDTSVQNQIESMDRANVQAIVYPTWGAPPQRLADIGPATEGAVLPDQSSALVLHLNDRNLHCLSVSALAVHSGQELSPCHCALQMTPGISAQLWRLIPGRQPSPCPWVSPQTVQGCSSGSCIGLRQSFATYRKVSSPVC